MSWPHEHFMRIALEQAKQAQLHDDVPVGAVLVLDNKVIGLGRNVRELLQQPTGHAEIVALEHGSRTIGSWRLEQSVLYVTLEPCCMCAGAIVNSRVGTVVFGAFDPKAGAVGSLLDICRDSRLNHNPTVISGVLAEPASNLLKAFFRKRRAEKKRLKQLEKRQIG